jgi:hypothetical protein
VKGVSSSRCWGALGVGLDRDFLWRGEDLGQVEQMFCVLKYRVSGQCCMFSDLCPPLLCCQRCSPSGLSTHLLHSVSTQHSPSALSQHSPSALILSTQSTLSTLSQHSHSAFSTQHSPSAHTLWPLAVQCCALGTRCRQDQDCVPWFPGSLLALVVFPELRLCWWLTHIDCCIHSSE